MKRNLQFKKVLKINADSALKAVSNFSKYEDFVPGCTGASLISRNPPIEIGRLEFNILGKKYFIQKGVCTNYFTFCMGSWNWLSTKF